MAAMKCWNGTWEDNGRFGMGGMFGGQRPDGFDRGNGQRGPLGDGQGRGEWPGSQGQEPTEGMEGQQPPEGFIPGQGGFDPGQGQQPPEGFDFGRGNGGRFGMGGMGMEDLSGDGETQFTLSGPVNNFSGVMDYAGT